MSEVRSEAPLHRDPQLYRRVNPSRPVHVSTATFTHVGIGIVRTRPCFPTRFT